MQAHLSYMYYCSSLLNVPAYTSSLFGKMMQMIPERIEEQRSLVTSVTHVVLLWKELSEIQIDAHTVVSFVCACSRCVQGLQEAPRLLKTTIVCLSA